tara:strand:+ start:1108 stop:1944 length:837 start_codon:yes stop_codon:yes gene_type:complete
MIIKSYSKINLTLKINSKSRNGLHQIQSFYCLINLFDQIKISKIKKKKDQIRFKGPFAKFIKNKDNSVSKVLNKLRKLKIIYGYFSIIIKKNIPVFGGLGGGTSNAAFITKNLLKRKINHNLLKKIDKAAGSDFILFLKNQGYLSKLGKVEDYKSKHKFYFVLIQPNILCSTKKIYSKVNKFSKKEKLVINITKSSDKFLKYLMNSCNDLQFIVERKYPLIKKLLTDIKNERGCYFSRMTGSGSVCYGLFKDQILAKNALNKLKNKYPEFWFSLAKTV